MIENTYNPKWGKYSVAIDGYVYSWDGKMILRLEEDQMDKMKHLSHKKKDLYIERLLKENDTT